MRFILFWVLSLVVVPTVKPAFAGELGRASTEYALVVTGGELLEGTISDAHTPFIARILRPLGLRCIMTLVVDDSASDIKLALESASRRSSMVLVTGGLGPTVNDITREVLSEFTGIPLIEDPEVLRELGRRFSQPPEQLRDNLRRQALVPQRGSYLPNSRGTAVGLIFDAVPATVVALPGPPRELQAMVTDTLVPWLRGRFDLPEQGIALKLRFVGIGQSSIDAAFRERVSLPPDVVVTSEFEGSRVDFTFSLPHAGEESERHLAALAAAAREHLGGHLYATNGASLEEVAVRRLLMRGERLTVVEVGGPHLAASLARSDAARTALAGSFAANSEEDLVRLLGIPRATWTASPRPQDRVQRLAEGARASTGSAWVLMVGAPSAAEGDRSVVWVGVGMPNGRWEHWRLVERSNPEAGRTSLVNEILDRLRKLEP